MKKKKKWYEDLIIKSNLANYSNTKGCIYIKHYGILLWNNIKKIINKYIIKSKYKNIYCPLLINSKIFNINYNHKKGFKLEKINIKNNNNKYIIRPTSETIIWKDYKNNIQSYRDLPILLNQWSNVIRWEKKNKFFIRNNEFFLQEAHSGHINKKQSLNEIKKIINLYKLFFKKYLALYTYSGLKSKLEKFSGSNFTYTFEILTKEKKSLQIATIHFLGTNFSKPYKIKFNNIKNKYKYIWSNSWGTSSRLIGSLCMTHVDKYGLILPPKIAPIKIIILLIIKNNYKKYKEMNQYIKKILYILKNNKINFLYKKVKTNIKQTMNKYENMGIPIRFNIGINEYNNNTIEVFRRDTYRIESIKFFNIIKYINNIFTIIQKKLYNKNKKFTLNNIYKINNNNNINNLLIKKKLFLLNWDGLKKTENYIKKKFKLTLRCIPCKYLFYNIKKNKSIISNKYTFLKAYFSKSY